MGEGQFTLVDSENIMLPEEKAVAAEDFLKFPIPKNLVKMEYSLIKNNVLGEKILGGSRRDGSFIELILGSFKEEKYGTLMMGSVTLGGDLVIQVA